VGLFFERRQHDLNMHLYKFHPLQILPYLLLFVYFGSLARNLADIFTGAAGLDTNTTIVMGVISGVAMVGIVWYTTYVSRRAMNEALREHASELPPEIMGDADVVTLLGGPEMNEEGSQGEGRPAPHTVPIISPTASMSIELAEQGSGSGPHRGRRHAPHSPATSAGSGETTALLEKKLQRTEGSNLHSRSAHASPRALSPVGSARRARATAFST